MVYLHPLLHPRPPPHHPAVHGPADYLRHCQQKGAQAEEGLRLPPGHAGGGADGGGVLPAGAALVCGRHRPLPRSRGQPQGGQREQRPRGDPTVRGGQVMLIYD